MAVAGERFTLDLSPDADSDDRATQAAAGLWSGVRDVTERFPSSVPEPPRAPTVPSATGFPAHKKRTKRSAFRRQRDGASNGQTATVPARPGTSPAQEKHKPNAKDDGGDVETTERKRIDEENRQRLAAMSEEEIRQEQQELLEHLSPTLVERLRTRLDLSVSPDTAEPGPDSEHLEPTAHLGRSSPLETSSTEQRPDHPHPNHDPEAPPRSPPTHLFPASIAHVPPVPRVHFPAPPLQPTLDPSAPDFLDALHQKYYPDLPSDPSKLAWMAPVSEDDTTSSSYSPHLASLPPSALRFDFKGDLLAPRTARAIPIAQGLHHHGDAPEAAGYTIPELARLARSTFPAQRCIAYQTLGRILYRLGSGRFGDEGSELVMGLWRCLEEGRVLETLHAEAGTLMDVTNGKDETEKDEDEGVDEEVTDARMGHHASAKALAVEALWNWQRGGGKRWKAQ